MRYHDIEVASLPFEDAPESAGIGFLHLYQKLAGTRLTDVSTALAANFAFRKASERPYVYNPQEPRNTEPAIDYFKSSRLRGTFKTQFRTLKLLDLYTRMQDQDQSLMEPGDVSLARVRVLTYKESDDTEVAVLALEPSLDDNIEIFARRAAIFNALTGRRSRGPGDLRGRQVGALVTPVVAKLVYFPSSNMKREIGESIQIIERQLPFGACTDPLALTIDVTGTRDE
jgi:hypothetical protein